MDERRPTDLEPADSHTGEDGLTWAALLGRWTEFAKAALALPETGDGGRWRAAVAPVIGLQAVTHALGDLDRLRADDRASATDRAEVLIRRYASELHQHWAGEPMPPELDELLSGARDAVETVRASGVEWRIAADRAEFEHAGTIAAAAVELGLDGDLYLPAAGVTLFARSVGAFVRARAGGPPPLGVVALVSAFLGLEEGVVDEPELVPLGRQVYRQFDFAKGGPVRDLVAPLTGEPVAGQPLLAAAVLDGEPQPLALPPRAGPPMRRLPVEEFNGLD